jgi:hypothetical protein
MSVLLIVIETDLNFCCHQESLDKQRKNAAVESGHDSSTAWGKFLQKSYQVNK